MTDISRRSFLRGFLTVAVVSAAPALPALGLPRIVGDGIHDDTAGLQAALDGKPFVCEGTMVTVNDGVWLNGGQFRITQTLHLGRTGKPANLSNCVFNATELPVDACALHVHENVYVGQHIHFNHFNRA